MSRRIPDDCTVRLIDLPAGVGGRISEAPDGHVDIYINARYGENGRRRALDHELDHYERGDLDNDLPIEVVEGRADLPPLRRARDLVPKPAARCCLPYPPESAEPPKARRIRSPHRPNTEYIVPPPTPAPPNLSPHQLRTLLAAVADLDAFICEPIF